MCVFAGGSERQHAQERPRANALYHDVRRDCGLFDNVHLRATAPQPDEM